MHTTTYACTFVGSAFPALALTILTHQLFLLAHLPLPSRASVLLTGPPGSGKSSTAQAAAAAVGVPLIPLDCTEIGAGILAGPAQAEVLDEVRRQAEQYAPCAVCLQHLGEWE